MVVVVGGMMYVLCHFCQWCPAKPSTRDVQVTQEDLEGDRWVAATCQISCHICS